MLRYKLPNIIKKMNYLGPPGSHSHSAALLLSANPVPCSSIPDLFLHSPCLVPFENTCSGSVSQSLDAIAANNSLRATASIFIKINHSLLSNNSNFDFIYSHPEALSQCKLYLESTYPNSVLVPVSSTSAAALKCMQEGGACIANSLCAEIYNLKIIDSDIQDIKDNYTRFLVFGNPSTFNLTSSIFLFYLLPRDRLLNEMLSCFNGCIIKNIYSRPCGKWKSFYFLEVDIQKMKVEEILSKASNYGDIRLYGSYNEE